MCGDGPGQVVHNEHGTAQTSCHLIVECMSSARCLVTNNVEIIDHMQVCACRSMNPKSDLHVGDPGHRPTRGSLDQPESTSQTARRNVSSIGSAVFVGLRLVTNRHTDTKTQTSVGAAMFDRYVGWALTLCGWRNRKPGR